MKEFEPKDMVEGNLKGMFDEKPLPKPKVSDLTRTLENLRIRFEIRRKR